MQRHKLWTWLRSAVICALVTLAANDIAYASAAKLPPDAVYKTPTLESMIDFMFSNGYIDPNNPQELIDYIRVKDCNLFQKYYSDDFTWNKIKTRIIDQSKVLQKDVTTHFVVSDRLRVDRYNFKTKAFDITENNRMNSVNSFNVLDVSSTDTCDNNRSQYGEKALSFVFDLRLDPPLSLRRIPMAEGMARYILPEISETGTSGEQIRYVYALIYFNLDGVMATTKYRTLLSGRIDKIEFFLDKERTKRIKTLDYREL